MIESFNEFLKKSASNEIFEKNNIGDDIPKVFTEDDFEKPDFVSDDKYIFKISSIVPSSFLSSPIVQNMPSWFGNILGAV